MFYADLCLSLNQPRGGINFQHGGAITDSVDSCFIFSERSGRLLDVMNTDAIVAFIYAVAYLTYILFRNKIQRFVSLWSRG